MPKALELIDRAMEVRAACELAYLLKKMFQEDDGYAKN
jgi:hypothetical protein